MATNAILEKENRHYNDGGYPWEHVECPLVSLTVRLPEEVKRRHQCRRAGDGTVLPV